MTGRRLAGRDRGSFTAEMAAGLPALLLFLLTGLTAVNAVSIRSTCLDAAREAALAASRGGDGTLTGSRYAPPGATVTVVLDGELVRATVRAPVRVLGGDLPAVTVVGVAVAVAEPGAPEPQP